MSRFKLILLALQHALHGGVRIVATTSISVNEPPPPTEPPAPAEPAPAEPPTSEPKPPPFDVGAAIDALAGTHAESLDWRHSIVDLMKTIGLDSGNQARRELAKELGYPGPFRVVNDGYAEMNRWLHAEVLRLVRERGIALPD